MNEVSYYDRELKVLETFTAELVWDISNGVHQKHAAISSVVRLFRADAFRRWTIDEMMLATKLFGDDVVTEKTLRNVLRSLVRRGLVESKLNLSGVRRWSPKVEQTTKRQPVKEFF